MIHRALKKYLPDVNRKLDLNHKKKTIDNNRWHQL